MIKQKEVSNIKWDMEYYLFILIGYRDNKRITVTLIKQIEVPNIKWDMGYTYLSMEQSKRYSE